MDKEKEFAIYKVQYPAEKLVSMVKIGLPGKLLLEEIFEKKWKVVYEYNDPDNIDKACHIPTNIKIYAYSSSSGDYADFINEYELEKVEHQNQPGEAEIDARKLTKKEFFFIATHLTYTSKKNKTCTIRRAYFDYD